MIMIIGPGKGRSKKKKSWIMASYISDPIFDTHAGTLMISKRSIIVLHVKAK